MAIHAVEPAVRQIARPTRGLKHGPVVRLMSPSDDFGEILKLFGLARRRRAHFGASEAVDSGRPSITATVPRFPNHFLMFLFCNWTWLLWELVERSCAGSARVSRSAGTGKTIVAVHRAVHLARVNPNTRVLLNEAAAQDLVLVAVNWLKLPVALAGDCPILADAS